MLFQFYQADGGCTVREHGRVDAYRQRLQIAICYGLIFGIVEDRCLRIVHGLVLFGDIYPAITPLFFVPLDMGMQQIS